MLTRTAEEGQVEKGTLSRAARRGQLDEGSYRGQARGGQLVEGYSNKAIKIGILMEDLRRRDASQGGQGLLEEGFWIMSIWKVGGWRRANVLYPLVMLDYVFCKVSKPA